MVRDVVTGRSLVDLLLVGGGLRCGVECCRICGVDGITQINEGRGQKAAFIHGITSKMPVPASDAGQSRCMIEGRADLA
jgi:hypothetical protein